LECLFDAVGHSIAKPNVFFLSNLTTFVHGPEVREFLLDVRACSVLFSPAVDNPHQESAYQQREYQANGSPDDLRFAKRVAIDWSRFRQ
jgi:hypothetical protein